MVLLTEDRILLSTKAEERLFDKETYCWIS